MDDVLGLIQSLSAQALVTLNQTLRQGEALTDQQTTCIGDFEPALGNALLELACDQPYAATAVPIYVSSVRTSESNECAMGMLNDEFAKCELVVATLELPLLWSSTENSADSFTPERPQPTDPVQITFNGEDNRLTLENPPGGITIPVHCDYDTTTGLALASSESSISDCEDYLIETIDQIYSIFEEYQPVTNL